MASKIDVRLWRLRSHLPEYRRRVDATLSWMHARMDEHCYCSFSAGKDSVVLLHLCRRIIPGIPVLMATTGVPFQWTQEDADKMTAWANDGCQESSTVRMFHWDKWGATDAAQTADESQYRAVVHAGQFVALKAWAQDHGLTCRMDGMRASEYGDRRPFLLKCRGDHRPKSLHPLWNWSTEDVWTYTVENNLPWQSIYDHLGPDARNGLIGRNGSNRGRLVYLRKFYPQAFLVAQKLFDAREFI